MKLIKVAECIEVLRKQWTPLAERSLKGDAEDILTLVAEFTLKKAKRLTTPNHVKNYYVKLLHSRIKSALKHRNIRHNYTESQIYLHRGEVDWGYSSRYELRQALNIALGSLPDDIRIDVWRFYVVEDSLTEISHSRGLSRARVAFRIKEALEKLKDHKALESWRPKR